MKINFSSKLKKRRSDVQSLHICDNYKLCGFFFIVFDFFMLHYVLSAVW